VIGEKMVKNWGFAIFGVIFILAFIGSARAETEYTNGTLLISGQSYYDPKVSCNDDTTACVAVFFSDTDNTVRWYYSTDKFQSDIRLINSISKDLTAYLTINAIKKKEKKKKNSPSQVNTFCRRDAGVPSRLGIWEYPILVILELTFLSSAVLVMLTPLFLSSLQKAYVNTPLFCPSIIASPAVWVSWHAAQSTWFIPATHTGVLLPALSS
jgi:hypothetical protein